MVNSAGNDMMDANCTVRVLGPETNTQWSQTRRRGQRQCIGGEWLGWYISYAMRDVQVEGGEDAVKVDGEEVGDPVVEDRDVQPQLGPLYRNVERQDEAVELEKVNDHLQLVQQLARVLQHIRTHCRRAV